jgi:hypothetical protein
MLTLKAPAARAVPPPSRKSRRRTCFSLSPASFDFAIEKLLVFNTKDVQASRLGLAAGNHSEE